MQPIVYDVAVSIDGYISGPEGDISKFAHEGPVVDDYLLRLSKYTCAIMGRATYEFGYQFGLAPGKNPYPHLETYVFSDTIELPEACDVEVIQGPFDNVLDTIQSTQTGEIYLCGGGQFAGSLISKGFIKTLRLKRAPILLGEGVKIFGGYSSPINTKCKNTKLYDNGYLYQEYCISDN